MQPVSSRIWTCVAVSISYDDNHYTTGISSMPYCLPIAGRRIIGFIFFPKVLVLCEMQTALSRFLNSGCCVHFLPWARLCYIIMCVCVSVIYPCVCVCVCDHYMRVQVCACRCIHVYGCGLIMGMYMLCICVHIGGWLKHICVGITNSSLLV